MRLDAVAIAAVLAALAACHQAPPQEQRTPAAGADTSRPAPSIPPPQTGPGARTPLAEPDGIVDGQSVQAATQMVKRYGALIEQKRWTEANRLWGDGASAAKFGARLVPYAEVHLQLGDAGQPEGAAGSIYLTQPVVFYGDITDGEQFRRAADVILRRINDVPGSSAEQRRWHIERIEWKGGS